ncbi:hypothetical protein ACE14D_23265 [Streptomyces sp. Act-28]
MTVVAVPTPLTRDLDHGDADLVLPDLRAADLAAPFATAPGGRG